jgi:hypothetical protein
MNKKKHLQGAVLKLIKAGAGASNDAQIARAIQTLPRRDRRILMREGKKAREQRVKQQNLEVLNGTQGGNLQDNKG